MQPDPIVRLNPLKEYISVHSSSTEIFVGMNVRWGWDAMSTIIAGTIQLNMPNKKNIAYRLHMIIDIGWPTTRLTWVSCTNSGSVFTSTISTVNRSLNSYMFEGRAWTLPSLLNSILQIYNIYYKISYKILWRLIPRGFIIIDESKTFVFITTHDWKENRSVVF